MSNHVCIYNPPYYTQEQFVEALLGQNLHEVHECLQRGVQIRLVDINDRIATIHAKQIDQFLKVRITSQDLPPSIEIHAVDFNLQGDHHNFRVLDRVVGTVLKNNPFKHTPCIWATTQGNLRLVSLFRSQGCLRDELDDQGNSPLMYAAKIPGAVDLVSLLLKTNKFFQRNRQGNTAFLIADALQNDEVCQTFFKHRLAHKIKFNASVTEESYEISECAKITDEIAYARWVEIVNAYWEPYEIGPHHPMRRDFGYALEESYDRIKQSNVPADALNEICAIKTQCLQELIKRQYQGTVTQYFTVEDFEDVIQQTEKLKNQEIELDDYLYADCDPTSLELAIAAYLADQKDANGEKLAQVYPVLCNRMPGVGGGSMEYETLQEKVSHIFANLTRSDPSSMPDQSSDQPDPAAKRRKG